MGFNFINSLIIIETLSATVNSTSLSRKSSLIKIYIIESKRISVSFLYVLVFYINITTGFRSLKTKLSKCPSAKKSMRIFLQSTLRHQKALINMNENVSK